MTITSKHYPVTITDEHPQSSYHIPVVVYRNKAHGDADKVFEEGKKGELEYSYSNGAMIKHNVAEREFANQPGIFDWLMRGVRAEHVHLVDGDKWRNHKEFVAWREKGRKEVDALFFGKK